MSADFVHLHVRSHYTLLGSPTTVPRLLAEVRRQGMDAVALTDRGNLFGACEFASAGKETKEKAAEGAKKAAEAQAQAEQAAAAAPGDAALRAAAEKAAAAARQAADDHGIKAILGCELNVAPLGMGDRTTSSNLQLVVLAQDAEGYRNLVRLVSSGWLEGFYYEPRVDLERLARHAKGLVCLTGAGPEGFLNRHLQAGNDGEALRQLGLLREAFADRLFVELCDHPQAPWAPAAALAKGAGLPVVATNWVHHLRQEDAAVHELMVAISEVTHLKDPRVQRRKLPTDQLWLKPAAAMAALFADCPEAIASTRAIAERCSGTIPTGQYFLPSFACPDGLDEGRYLERLCREGLAARYAGAPPPGAEERLRFELDTVVKMGFPGYFLIVADFINWAKRRGIPVGPGRGSAAGSLVAYCLGITDMCPLRYGLLFERFLNPGRKSMPDIDVDFCKDRRDEVIDYVKGKYGAEAVTNIMTLGTMKARAAIKDVARAHEWTPEESQELANLVPNNPAKPVDLPQALGKKAVDKEGKEWATVDALVKRYEGDPRTRTVVDGAMQLEKLGRALGVHACGIVVAPGPVSEYMPVCSVKGKPATQFNMTQVEKCGLLKMDFLGLKTMTVLKKTIDIVAAGGGPAVDLLAIPLDDPRTFEMLGHGDTLGVFQCESRGFQELLRRLRPDRFEDMIALVALYRPGPLMAGMHNDYCDRKHGLQRVEYPHPALEEVLKETYGLYIYQEQVMSISRELCGFTPAEADDLRKAMGKKDKKTLEKLQQKFIDGAWQKHRFDRAKCQAMWENILGFASYCFNKSHSACYGLIAYWTAWFKANHYAAFMTANLIYEMDNKDKMTRFVEELRSKGIPVLPPDVNGSGWEFTLVQRPAEPAPAAPPTSHLPPPTHSQAIRFGFGGVKAVGEGAARLIVEERARGGEFRTLYDLCERLDTRTINKRVLESLAKVGALDSLHANRRALCETLERALAHGQRSARTRSERQETLFAAFGEDQAFKAATQGYPDVPDWPPLERLAHEKALTGYWISSHPVAEARDLAGLATDTIAALAGRPEGQRVAVLAVVVGVRAIRTKTGRSMAVLAIEDRTGRQEAVLFPGGTDRRGQPQPGAYERFQHACGEDQVALFVGSLKYRKDRRSAPPPSADDDEGGPPETAGDDEGGEPAAAPAQAEEAEAMPNLEVLDVIPVAAAHARLARGLELWIDLAEAGGERLAATEIALKEHGGDRPVTARLLAPDGVELTVHMGERWQVDASPALTERLRGIWGAPRVRVRLASAEQVLGAVAGGAGNGASGRWEVGGGR